VIRLAIILLFTTRIRRGELLNLMIGDYNRRESTLDIRETNFTNRVCFPSTRVLPMRLTAIYVPEKSGNSPLFRYGTHLELFVGWRSV
jgi:integrase